MSLSFARLTEVILTGSAAMRCRVGDLAILVGPKVPENLGVLVEVLKPWRHGPNHWWVRSLSGPLRRDDGRIAVEGSADDSGLRPIRGQSDNTEVEADLVTADVACG